MNTNKFKQTEIGEVPQGWEIKPAEEFCLRVTDGTHDSPQKQSAGKFLVTSRHLKEGHLDFDNAYFISEEDYIEVNRRSKVDRWDVIFSMIGTIGEIYLEKNRDINYAIKNVGLFKSGGELKGKWLYYYFQSQQAKRYIHGSRAGTTQEYMTLESLRKFPIIFPFNIHEMRRIIDILDSIQEKIEINHHMNKTLESIAQAIFKRWFVDFEFPDKNGKPYKSSGGKMVKSELGEIPEGWSVKEISDCGEVICGKTPPTVDKENYGDDIFFITIPDMRGQVFVIKTERKLSKKGASIQKRKELPPLAICVSCIATPGLVSLTSDTSHTNQQINSIVCNKDISQFFMYYKMFDKSEEIKSMGLGGTATLNLNTGNFAQMKIVISEEAIMDAFHKIVTPFMEKILSNSKEDDSLCNIRDSLLPRLMLGKIKVN